MQRHAVGYGRLMNSSSPALTGHCGAARRRPEWPVSDAQLTYAVAPATRRHMPHECLLLKPANSPNRPSADIRPPRIAIVKLKLQRETCSRDRERATIPSSGWPTRRQRPSQPRNMRTRWQGRTRVSGQPTHRRSRGVDATVQPSLWPHDSCRRPHARQCRIPRKFANSPGPQ